MTPAVPETTAHDAVTRADAGEVLLLDVREEQEWLAGHAPQAVHAPLSQLQLAAIPLDRPIVAVCRSGNRSGQLTAALVPRGIDIVNLVGGMGAWQAAGLPVVRDDGTPGQVL